MGGRGGGEGDRGGWYFFDVVLIVYRGTSKHTGKMLFCKGKHGFLLYN